MIDSFSKFVDSHLKPYRCKAESCEAARFSSTACLLRHEREAHGLHGHGDKPFLCIHEGCDRSMPGNGFPRQWNLRDHMKRVHNDRSSAGGSPPSAPAQPVAKGRKRKPDVPENQAPTSRKASIKTSVPEVKPVPAKPLVEQWIDYHRTAQDLLSGIDSPPGVKTLEQISVVQKHLDTMAKMASDWTPMTSGSARRGHASTG